MATNRSDLHSEIGKNSNDKAKAIDEGNREWKVYLQILGGRSGKKAALIERYVLITLVKN